MLPTEEEERKGKRGWREARTRCVLQGIIEHDDGFIRSRRNRRHLQCWSPTELGKETQSLDPNVPLRDQGGSFGLVLFPLWEQ